MTGRQLGSTADRVEALDGLRGLAAVVVFLSHAFFSFAPWMMRVHYPTAQKEFPDPGPLGLAVQPWVPSLFFNGWLAVAVFFVLSGIVLATGAGGERGRVLVLRRTVARYPRLMIPALASTLLACALMMAGAMNSVQAASSLAGSTWFAQRYNFEPSLADAALQGAWYTFTVASDSYNPPLWTLSRELAASWMLFAFLLVTKSVLIRIALLIPALAGLYFLADLRLLLLGGCLLAGGALAPLLAKPRLIVGLVMLTFGLLLAAYDFSDGMHWLRQLLNPCAVLLGFQPDTSEPWLTLAALLIVFGALHIRWVTGVLASGVLKWLGKHTFAIYLLHFPILCVTGAWVFVHLYQTAPTLAAVAAVTASAVVTGVLMLAFTRLVDEPAMKVGRLVGRIAIPDFGGRKSHSEEAAQ